MKTRKRFLFVLFAFLAFFVTSCSASPSSVVKNFYNAVENNQYEKAAGYLSSNAISTFGLSKLEQVIASQADILIAQGGVKSLEITDESIVDDYATVTLKITMENGSVSSDKVSLVKEDGKWKIDIGK